MPAFIELPDLEAISASSIRNAAISGLTGVYSSIPRNPTWPIIVVRRIGGQPAVREMLDAALIQVDVWGGARDDATPVPKSTAHDIAQAARVVLLEMEGTAIHDPVDVFVTAVRDANGLAWLVDPDTGRERYSFAVYVYGRTIDPLPGS